MAGALGCRKAELGKLQLWFIQQNIGAPVACAKHLHLCWLSRWQSCWPCAGLTPLLRVNYLANEVISLLL